MHACDLEARGFTYHPTLSKAYTYCRPCRSYQWFGWWLAPEHGIRVAACETCADVPTDEARHVERFPVVRAREPQAREDVA